MSIKNNTVIMQDLLNAINALPEAGGVKLPSLTNEGSASDLLFGKQLIDGYGDIITGNIPTVIQATPSINVSSDGLITASATQTTGYISAGTKSSTYQLAFQPAKTITPSTTSQIAVSSGYYTGGDIIVAGDSNLVAGNIKSGISIFGVNGIYRGSGDGDTSVEDSLIMRTISDYANDRVTSIGPYAFTSCYSLTTVDFPAVTSIRGYAFYDCSNLTTISFPAVITIGSYAFSSCSKLTTAIFPAATSTGYGAFNGCRSLTTADFPAATTVDNYAFNGCYNLTTANFPVATSIGLSAFGKCTKLTTINFPVATYISDYAFTQCNLTTLSFPTVSSIGHHAFYSCRSLTTVDFPAATNIGTQAFADCSKLTTINLPAVTYIESYTFQWCSNLTTVDFPAARYIGSAAFANCYSLATASFPAVTSIGSSAFSKCYNLKSLYLTGSSLCILINSYVFTSTPIGGYSKSAGTYGSIYVPASLLTSYQTATNWTYLSSRFVAYDLITFTIDGTEYQAEEGMTWAEWCDSEYNTDNQFFIGSNDVVKSGNNQGQYNEVHYNNIPVLSNNEIIQDAAYIIIAPGAGA